MEVKLGGRESTRVIGKFVPQKTGGWNKFKNGVFVIDENVNIEGFHCLTFVGGIDCKDILHLKSFQLLATEDGKSNLE